MGWRTKTGTGQRGTEVWERVISGTLHKKSKMVDKMIEKCQNNTTIDTDHCLLVGCLK